MIFKKLITSGCSYSQVPNSDITWPVHLKNYLNIDTEFHGKGAAGNGIISRTIIYNVINALKNFKPEEILVGIMWSGLDRFEIYRTEKDIDYTKIIGDKQLAYANPQAVITQQNYFLIHPIWDDESSKLFYKNIYSPEHGCIFNLEHIIRTQWFLETNKIKYFMMAFDNSAFSDNHNTNEDISFLTSLINYDNWIKEKNMGRWARETGLPFARPPDPHPSTEMHKLYVEQHIIPHLQNKNYI